MPSPVLTWITASLALLGVVHGNISVNPSQSIQAAIDAAKPGDQIIVQAGTYYEQLTISKSHISLVAEKGAVLKPPRKKPAISNGCVGLAGNNTVAGICIIGTGVKLAPFRSEHRKVSSVGSFVEGVKVSGFSVQGFYGLNIAVVGAKNTEVRNNTVSDGAYYGILTVGSKGSIVAHNTVKAKSIMFIGICMDDKSNVSVTQNTISSYAIGLCIETNGADVSNNKVNKCCFGAYVDPFVSGAQVTGNQFGPSPRNCSSPAPVWAAGVTIAGAVNTNVSRNTITGISDGHNPKGLAVGILVYDDTSGAKVATAKNNHITYNTLSKNDQDVANYSKGNNQIDHNN
ncbi:pectin lyase-like protein [Thozetella sp. PMI_491]|nr:pectin lyase-like protein [Thozetella sp. PMI_491]